MRKAMKRVMVLILSVVMSLSAVMLLESRLEISAGTPMIFSSETWNGTGAASIVVKQISMDRFLGVYYKNEEVDKANYSVGEQDGNTVITFREEYLQSLDLQNGGNNFMAEFRGIADVPLQNYILVEGKNEIVIDGTLNAKVSRVTLEKSASEEEDVDKTQYTLTNTNGNLVITFHEDYLQSMAGDKVFHIYVVQDVLVMLEVVKGEASDAPAGSEEPVITAKPIESEVPTGTALPPESDEPVFSEVPKNQNGDVDNNGKVELNDAQIVLKAALKIIELSEEQIRSGDMNADKKITLEDDQSILKIALKIE